MKSVSNGGGRTFEGPFFSMRIPLTWEVEVIENIPAIFDPEGGGVLQIASFRRGSGVADPKYEIEIFLNQNGIEADPSRMAEFALPSGLDCVAVEYVLDNRFWMVNAICKENRLLLVTYNSDEMPEASLAMLISEIIGTIKFTES
jgi:hypothetical protein